MNLNGEDTSQREYISRPPGTQASEESSSRAENDQAQAEQRPSENITPQTSDSNNAPAPSSNNPNPHFDMDFD